MKAQYYYMQSTPYISHHDRFCLNMAYLKLCDHNADASSLSCGCLTLASESLQRVSARGRLAKVYTYLSNCSERMTRANRRATQGL